MPRMVRAEGVVWCLDHGCAHDDTTDPYGYGKADCRREEHRLLYWRPRRHDEEYREPEGEG